MARVLTVDARAPDAAIIAEAVRVLRAGGLVAMPTETVYGLAARALDEHAVARVYAAKGRPAHHPLIAHVESEAQARVLAASWPAKASLVAKAFWPGPVTVVVDRAPDVPAAVSGGGPSIAIRAPAHPVALALLHALGEPVAAPSANRFQGLSPTTAEHVVKELGDAVDLVLDAGPCDAGIESTVVDLRGPHPRVLRPGALDLASLRQVLPDVEAPTGSVRDAEARASPGMEARHYAPRARLLLADTWEEARRIAYGLAATGARVGLVTHEKRTRRYPRSWCSRGPCPATPPSTRASSIARFTISTTPVSTSSSSRASPTTRPGGPWPTGCGAGRPSSSWLATGFL